VRVEEATALLDHDHEVRVLEALTVLEVAWR
jgi:hypothetical protein